MTDSFQVAAIIASDFCFVKKQIACIFVAFLCRNVLESAPGKCCRDQKSRRNIFWKISKTVSEVLRHREKGKKNNRSQTSLLVVPGSGSFLFLER